MNPLLIQAIFNVAAFVVALVLMFVLFRKGFGVALYPVALVAGGLIWAVGQLVVWAIQVI